ncbi:hypothetical protein PDIG_85610 [Penicillium digitatum PHI26]|uniref:Uncharacterized protein n=2 Tax=Penicillium digitatum TaxID=36651 RepID=K9F7C6_PEND2|nr:hypothetical protein PDIG_85610 [Penicillium digitatum PHI26]
MGLRPGNCSPHIYMDATVYFTIFCCIWLVFFFFF